MMRSPRGVLAGRIVAAMIVALSSCSREKPPPPRPPAPVTVAVAVTKSVPVQVSGIGTVEPFQSVAVKPRVSGQLTSIRFTEGQDVEEGELLFVIDRRPFQAALRQAQAELAKDVAAARYAEVEARRFAALVEAGVASRETAEQHAANARVTRAAVEADRAAVDTAKLALDFCSIRAPIAGRTGTALVKPGNVVQADTTTLVVINRVHPIYVTFSVPERQLAGINAALEKSPLAVQATAPSAPDEPSLGTLRFVENTVDPTTGTIRLRGTFPNEDDHLWPGQFVNVTVTLSSLPNAIVVPAAALQTGQQGPYVFVVKPDLTVEQRSISPGPLVGDEAVILSGVAAGDRVVTDGQLRLVPGAKVTIQPTPTASEAP
jgi:multidrug efflux system membrane fusion protein